jgi:hypothetical protein
MSSYERLTSPSVSLRLHSTNSDSMFVSSPANGFRFSSEKGAGSGTGSGSSAIAGGSQGSIRNRIPGWPPESFASGSRLSTTPTRSTNDLLSKVVNTTVSESPTATGGSLAGTNSLPSSRTRMGMALIRSASDENRVRMVQVHSDSGCCCCGGGGAGARRFGGAWAVSTRRFMDSRLVPSSQHRPDEPFLEQ